MLAHACASHVNDAPSERLVAHIAWNWAISSSTIGLNHGLEWTASSHAASFGQQCGDLAVFARGPGSFGFGRNSAITGFFCAPARLIQLGHDNDLTGQFIADEVNSDSNNRGHCCGGADCACFDHFSPTSARAGDTITLFGSCPLSGVGAVRICGLAAAITSRAAGELRATVPAGATGACAVEVASHGGAFTGVGALSVE